eukprot:CAMPEP_0185904196 /NCGR_PEP_ID=MMETSP0196C-20130402/3513_1 /TAXON_ID=2932 /ORGANISM="Alexandrium fundyense, Strain CCMP1719" /LENGTH=57 /DNA_ID=CAMNT_0028623461 /DNA_START=119 /DNA_END=292 /DNA_ORIENTATION=+
MGRGKGWAKHEAELLAGHDLIIGLVKENKSLSYIKTQLAREATWSNACVFACPRQLV